MYRDAERERPSDPLLALCKDAGLSDKHSKFEFASSIQVSMLPEVCRTAADFTHFITRFITIASQHRRHDDLQAATQLQSLITGYGTTNWPAVGAFMAARFAAYITRKGDPRALHVNFIDLQTMMARVSASAPPAYAASPQPRQSATIAAPPASRPRTTAQRPTAARIPGTPIPAPLHGTFCNQCGLHGWRYPKACPRCRGNAQELWLAAHVGLGRSATPPAQFAQAAFLDK
jgi:hypothetical protein